VSLRQRRLTHTKWLAAVLVVAAGGKMPGAVSQQPSALDALRQAIAAERTSAARRLPALEVRDLTHFYEAGANAPAWGAGRPSEAAQTALALLERAADDGLDPDDYAAKALTEQARRLIAGPPSVAAAAAFDVALTSAMLRFYRHLHLGRVDPRTLGLQIVAPDDGHDFAVSLRVALDSGRLAQVAADLSPPLAQYRWLRDMLAQYRALAAAAAPPPPVERTLEPGDATTDLTPLRRFLVAVGDLPLDVAPSGVYDEPVVEGVRHFQARHGLAIDGVIGPATRAALAVPLSWRLRQIELALERLRWLPDLTAGRLIVVNIPMFRLWAWNRVPSTDPPALTMAVIVGRSLGTRTPVFADRMERVIFRPYWNVPRSIVRNEILPAITRDPDYLAKQNFEIVRGQADASPTVPVTAAALEELARGTVRVRQRPGGSNALGLVKLMFPNQNDVYMHDTPAPYLFERSRRDFSHGCIRVEQPAALAEWVLAPNPGWSRDAVTAAMHGTANRQVDLADPVQVLIFYTTAVVDPSDRRVHFAEDIYRQDARLDQAL
jgi:murein L,D-transpeptidase YcbB/YkuD